MLSKTFTLYEGMITDDLDLLDKNTYYPKEIILSNVEQLFSSIQCIEDLTTIRQNRDKVRIFARRFVQIDNYGIHVILKWLVYSHGLLDHFQIKKIFDIYQQVISKIELDRPVLATNQFEYYMKKILLKPYLQYLQKLSNIKITQLITYKKKRINLKEIKQFPLSLCIIEKQLLSEALSQQQIVHNWYKMYNLVQFTILQFQKPLNELKGYFQQCYPYLNNLNKYLIKDLKALHIKLRQQYKYLKQSNIVSLIQMEELENKVNQFIQRHRPRMTPINTFFTNESCEENYKKHFINLDEFMGSNKKENDQNQNPKLKFNTKVFQ